MKMTEQWRPVVGYEGLYEVSDQGRVRGLTSGRIISQWWAGRKSKQYLSVHLYRGNRRATLKVHRLVALAFLGTPAEGQECCHGPLGTSCNAVTNLSWGTRVQNRADRKRDGTEIQGEDSHKAKLKREDIAEIKKLAEKGWTHRKIAAHFNLKSHATIGVILRGKSWAWLEAA
jgi:hypothetical protein